MKIIKDGKEYCIKKMLACDNWGSSYDIEFEDEHGNYRHWKSDFDGGKLVNDDLTDIEMYNGNIIQSRVMINDKECFVIGYNPENELSPYVTWAGTLKDNGWDYYWGDYCDTLESALTDLAKRIPKKMSQYPNPTQVMYLVGNSQCCHYGIAFRNMLIDLRKGESYDLTDPLSDIKIIDDEMGWTELDETFGGDFLYLGE